MKRLLLACTLVAFAGAAQAQTIAAARLPDPIAELREVIARRYAYRALAHVDWRARVDEFTLPLRATNTRLGFAEVASRLLAVAADPHVFVEADDRRIYPTRAIASTTVDRTLVAALVPNIASDERCVSYGYAGEGVGYIAVGGWTDGCAAAAQYALDTLGDPAALVIDVRTSHGGEDGPAAAFAGRFVEKETRYAWVDAVTDEGFGARHPRVLRPNPHARRYAGRVAVLMGPTTMGSGEAFLLMMRAAGAKLVGDVTYGSIGEPQPTSLSNGVVVWLPATRDYTLDGRLVEGAGISPDLRVAWPRTPTEDLVLRAALDLLRAR